MDFLLFFVKQKTAYDMRISDWSSDVCSSDLQAALAAGLARPLAVVNIGGVANVTWIGPGEDRVLAFDTGPGNALINDWVEQHGLEPLDRDGALAAAGRVDAAILAGLLDNPYFERRSEEHTSELQSLMRISYAVFCLKKKRE